MQRRCDGVQEGAFLMGKLTPLFCSLLSNSWRWLALSSHEGGSDWLAFLLRLAATTLSFWGCLSLTCVLTLFLRSNASPAFLRCATTGLVAYSCNNSLPQTLFLSLPSSSSLRTRVGRARLGGWSGKSGMGERRRRFPLLLLPPTVFQRSAFHRRGEERFLLSLAPALPTPLLLTPFSPC